VHALKLFAPVQNTTFKASAVRPAMSRSTLVVEANKRVQKKQKV
jgi:hypothetical protein